MPASGVYQWLAVIQVDGAHYEDCVPILSDLFDAEFYAENSMSLRYYKQEPAFIPRIHSNEIPTSSCL